MAEINSETYNCAHTSDDSIKVDCNDEEENAEAPYKNVFIECVQYHRGDEYREAAVILTMDDALALADQIYAAFAGPLQAQLRKIGIKQEEPT